MNRFTSITEVSAESFAPQVLHSELPVVVAVCADGCPASRRLLSLLETWAPKADGRLKVVRIRAEHAPELALPGGVTSVPALVLFHRGAVSYQFIGELARSELDDLLAHADFLVHTTPALQRNGLL